MSVTRLFQYLCEYLYGFQNFWSQTKVTVTVKKVFVSKKSQTESLSVSMKILIPSLSVLN